MSFVTRGFSGRNRERDPRLPPGQTKVEDWPVLSAGPTPRIDTADWSFTVLGLHRLELLHAIENVASCRVAKRSLLRSPPSSLTRTYQTVFGFVSVLAYRSASRQSASLKTFETRPVGDVPLRSYPLTLHVIVAMRFMVSKG